MYSFVTEPIRFPHKCLSCGIDTDREWWVDLGEDYYSQEVTAPTVYVCNLCFVALAKDKGLVDEKPLLAKIEDLEARLFNAKVIAEALEQGLDGLLRSRFIDPDSPAAVELVSFLENHKAEQLGEQGTGEQLEAGEGIPSESTDVEDVGSIRPSLKLDGSS